MQARASASVSTKRAAEWAAARDSARGALDASSSPDRVSTTLGRSARVPAAHQRHRVRPLFLLFTRVSACEAKK